MNGSPVQLPIVALLDRDGRLLSAGAPLLRLQAAAGGQPNGPLAPPALAAMVRLALRLRVPLSRSVELAGDEADLSLWIQIRPEGEGLRLAIADWQERGANGGAIGGWPARAGGAGTPGWHWEVDEHMRFRHADAGQLWIGHAAPDPGQSFTGYFALEEAAADGEPAGEGLMPIVGALVRRVAFTAQPARLRSDAAVRYLLSGDPMFDRAGAFIGYRGRAEPVVLAAPVQRLASLADVMPPARDGLLGDQMDPALGRRLDRALRQPLDRIIAHAGAIGDRSEGPLRQDYVNFATDIESAGRHLLGLVDDLSDLQAIERSALHPASEAVDLSAIAQRAAALLNVRAETRQIRIQAPAGDEDVVARAEHRRVLQILVNLIGNAVRHSPSDSTIWVRVDEDGGTAKVIVADQGGGIDPADHGRVFERFERLGVVDGEGSGLGLYISRQLARAMGGDVTLESALGQGARFTLVLPAWRASQTGTRAG